MAEQLSIFLSELISIRTYLVKIGPSRRYGSILVTKRGEANNVLLKYNEYLEHFRSKSASLTKTEVKVINKICEEFSSVLSEVLKLCTEESKGESSSSSDQGEIMSVEMFDLKIAINLLPVMTDGEDNIKQLIHGIEYYNTVLTKTECKNKLIQFVLKSRLSQHATLKLLPNYESVDELTKDMRRLLLPPKSYTAIQAKLHQCRQNDKSISDFGKELSELFVNLTVSQANGNSKNYNILRPLNEKLAIKRFADGLRNRRLSTIVAARNFSSLSDAIQAAQDEEVTSPGTSAEVMGMYRQNSRGNN